MYRKFKELTTIFLVIIFCSSFQKYPTVQTNDQLLDYYGSLTLFISKDMTVYSLSFDRGMSANECEFLRYMYENHEGKCRNQYGDRLNNLILEKHFSEDVKSQSDF